MKKQLLLLIIIALSYTGYAQCDVNEVTETILVNGVAGGQPVCYGKQVSTKLTDLQDGVTYTIAYPGYTQSKTYWSDGNFASITWPLGTLTQPLTYTITGRADGCSQSTSVTIIGNTINIVSNSPSVMLTPSTDPSQVCYNSTISLTASGTPGLTYTWHASPAIDRSFAGVTTVFYPDQPATYWVTGIESQCGTSAESNHVSVNFVPTVSNPTITLLSGSTTRCVGAGTTSLDVSASNASNYSWAITSAGSSTISSSGLITWDPNFVGAAQITAIAYGCGGSSVSKQITANVNTISPATLSGGGAACSGVAVPLRLVADYGSLDDVWYSLYLDGNFVSQQRGYDNSNDHPVSSISWSQSNDGRYTVTATGNGCTNISMEGAATISIIQPSQLTITTSSDPNKVCSGDTFNLTASGGTTYTWHSNISQPDINGFDQGNVHGSIFSPYLSALYWVTGAESNCGTSSTSNNEGVTISALPDATISPVGNLKICSYCTQAVNAVRQPNNTYQWQKDGTIIPGATSSSYAANQGGAYSVLIVSGTGCSNFSSNLQLAINAPPAVGISNQTLVLPTNSTTLTASASDPDGMIVSYLWTQLTGSDATKTGDLTNSLILSGLGIGSYQFQISVTDDFGEMKRATVMVQVNAPFNNYNYVRESSILISGKTQPSGIFGLPVEQKNITTTYFDGLGRAMQTVSTQSSPNNKADIVTPVTYDEFGRENKKFLPYVSTDTDGSFKPSGLTEQNSFYNSPLDKIAGDTRSFSETLFESSPLNRPLQQFGPGQNWKDNNKYVGHSYEVNGAADVILFIYNPSTGLVSTGQAQYYNSGQLQANRTMDEHGNDVIEYLDKLGHTTCKKVQYKTDGNGNKLYASTYYIYDDLNNLVVVLPPEAIKSALSSLTKN